MDSWLDVGGALDSYPMALKHWPTDRCNDTVLHPHTRYALANISPANAREPERAWTCVDGSLDPKSPEN
eukprot:1955565-Pyramimonas_sp.AAC.1